MLEFIYVCVECTQFVNKRKYSAMLLKEWLYKIHTFQSLLLGFLIKNHVMQIHFVLNVSMSHLVAKN